MLSCKFVYLLSLLIRFKAQVVMRIVDPQVAIAMLHRETPTQTQPFHQMPAYSNPTGISQFGAPGLGHHKVGVLPPGIAPSVGPPGYNTPSASTQVILFLGLISSSL